MNQRFDIVYCEGYGDIVGSFENWTTKTTHSNSPVEPDSAQFFQFAEEINASTYALSACIRPAESPPRSVKKRLLLFADKLFFRFCACATFCLSAAAERQVRALVGRRSHRIIR